MDKHIEYRADALKISGFGMLAPAGRVFYEPVSLINECGLLNFILYILLAYIVGRTGLWCILRGYRILERSKNAD